MSYQSSVKRGFTLLELLIVISIIAALSLILIFALNPAEILRKSRDAQRLSDLNTLKTALSVYITSTSTPVLDGITTTAPINLACRAGHPTQVTWNSGDKIWYSYFGVTDTGLDGGTVTVGQASSAANNSNVDGNGWVPIAFENLTAGSPISNLPIDPTNTVSSVSAISGSDLVYRYVCNASSTTFEIDAQLESNEYTVQNDLRAKDGGNNSSMYEAGTNLKILGTGTDF
jgi:prepilin-type N-terminal cleavage/methylation domain-containing protein